MYDGYYNLAALPFENTADPRFFYASEQHREALAAIEYTIRLRKGIVLVTGNIGSGKTTIGRAMLERCGNEATILQLVHGHAAGTEVLRHICRLLQLSSADANDRGLMLEQLEKQLHQYASINRPLVLFVDEAQSLSDEALEELRLLSNFDTNTVRLLQLVLVGHPELRDRIARPEMSALRQRIVMAKRLTPLDLTDTRQYLAHRLRIASRDPQNIKVTFTDEAVEAVYSVSRGIPRLINVIGDNCLLLGFVKQSHEIDQAMVLHVISDMVPTFNTLSSDSPNETCYRLAGNM